MDIEWFRDLVICIWGIIAAIGLIIITILAIIMYRRLKVVLNSIEETTQKGKQLLASFESSATVIHDMVASINQELFKPVMQVVSIIQGIRYGVDMIGNLFKQKQGGNDDR